MRKLILYIASSLDSYIARNSGDVDWLFTDQDYGYTDFLARIDTVLMGRNTYEKILTFGEYPYQATQGFVFSQTPKNNDNNVEFVSTNLEPFIQNLKSLTGKDIWLVGGGQIIQLCLQNNLIDEFIISLHPIVLGDGIPLFPAPLTTKTLSLQHCKTFETGLVQLTYIRS